MEEKDIRTSTSSALTINGSDRITIVDEESIRARIYEVRGEKVILDFELADIYGYTTKAFNQQVQRNIDRFPDDFRFQLTEDEVDSILRSQNVTSSWGGSRYLPYAFTESGVYMLMTVLRGKLAVEQSKALIRTFRSMKDYIIENQGMIGQNEYLRLSLQVADNMRDIALIRSDLDELEKQMSEVLDQMSNVVSRSEISPFLLDFGNPAEKREYLILNGQPAKAAETYIDLYSRAKETIVIIDDYINIKTLRLLQDVGSSVEVTIYSDNKGNKLHARDIRDFSAEFPNINCKFRRTEGMIHDRFLILDAGTSDEKIYLCGASSKDAGDRTTVIAEMQDKEIALAVLNRVKDNPILELK